MTKTKTKKRGRKTDGRRSKRMYYGGTSAVPRGVSALRIDKLNGVRALVFGARDAARCYGSSHVQILRLVEVGIICPIATIHGVAIFDLGDLQRAREARRLVRGAGR